MTSLRDALSAAYRDPAFLAEAAAMRLHFQPKTAAEIYQVMREVLVHFGVILAGALGTLALSLIGMAILSRGGCDRATAYFASMPGGASEMVNLASRTPPPPAASPPRTACASRRRAWRPTACGLEGLAQCWKPCAIAAHASGRSGVVAAWSR